MPWRFGTDRWGGLVVALRRLTTRPRLRATCGYAAVALGLHGLATLMLYLSVATLATAHWQLARNGLLQAIELLVLGMVLAEFHDRMGRKSRRQLDR